jgi:catechol 2,3-dioxygenase-like lactoylglutathione lyase family enzyme
MKIDFQRIHHVQLCIPIGEEDRAREFYGRVLGLKEIEKPDNTRKHGGMWYEIADIQLHIGVEDARETSKRHPAFQIIDSQAVRKYLEENGVRTRDEEEVNGMKRFSIWDPFGNRIELVELP